MREGGREREGERQRETEVEREDEMGNGQRELRGLVD
jgi:hypothetical protein